MQRSWLKLAPMLAAALGAGCADHHPLPDPPAREGSAQQAVAPDYRPKTIARVPTCSELSLGSVWMPRIDFGRSAARSEWRLLGEAWPPDASTPISETLVWLGVQASDQPMRCTASPGECEVGGSQLRLERESGGRRLIQVHWEPAELPTVEPGTKVKLELDSGRGTLLIKTQADDALLLAVVRYGARGGDEARSWSFGPFEVSTDRPTCTATSQPCNLRLTALALRFAADGTSVALDPGQDMTFELAPLRFRLAHDMAGLNGLGEAGDVGCGIGRTALDAFSILRE